MAATRLIKHHIAPGRTIAASLKDRLDYGKNPVRTNGGELIRAYECDHECADAEFLLAKAKYQATTGREQKRDADVLCYQIRQSFAPGEVTPEQANAIGYDLAMRELLNGAKLPRMDTLKAEGQQLLADKKSGYREYRAAQKDMREIVTVKADIDHLLGITGREKNKEQER